MRITAASYRCFWHGGHPPSVRRIRWIYGSRRCHQVDPVARCVATRIIAEFFSAPLIGDRSRIKLVVDNSRC